MVTERDFFNREGRSKGAVLLSKDGSARRQTIEFKLQTGRRNQKSYAAKVNHRQATIPTRTNQTVNKVPDSRCPVSGEEKKPLTKDRVGEDENAGTGLKSATSPGTWAIRHGAPHVGPKIRF